VRVKRAGRGFLRDGSGFRTCPSPSASVDLSHLSRGQSRRGFGIFRTCLEPEAEGEARPASRRAERLTPGFDELGRRDGTLNHLFEIARLANVP
jgi:hypothetical protein